MADHLTPPGPPPAGYGARVVAIDTLRGLTLAEPQTPTDQTPTDQTVVAWRSRDLSPQQISDRLSLAHWPWGHQIVVCSLAGGVGRTTVAGLLATVLAERGFAHLWPPIALQEDAKDPVTSALRRWDVTAPDHPDDDLRTRSGAWVFTGGQPPRRREDYSTLIIDAPAGHPATNHTVAVTPSSSVLLVVRPDRASLAEAAEVLVSMHDRQQVARDRVVVMVNHTSHQPVDRASKTAAAVLSTRCSAVHRLGYHPQLRPGRVLPSGPDLPDRTRRVMTATALDLWGVATYAQPARCRTPRSPS